MAGNPEGAERDWYVSREEFFDLLLRMVGEAAKIRPVPHCVIGSKRSGLFPAVVVSHQLKLPMFTAEEIPRIPTERIKSALLVDTSAWSGKSMRRLIRRTENAGLEVSGVIVMYTQRGDKADVPGMLHLAEADCIPRFWYDEEALGSIAENTGE